MFILTSTKQSRPKLLALTINYVPPLRKESQSFGKEDAWDPACTPNRMH